MIQAMRRFRLLVVTESILLASPPLHAAGEHHWSYSGDTGPAQWAALESDYSACGVGKLQSPIDIRASAVKKGHLPAIAFDYKPSPLKIVDNGHHPGRSRTGKFHHRGRQTLRTRPVSFSQTERRKNQWQERRDGSASCPQER